MWKKIFFLFLFVLLIVSLSFNYFLFSFTLKFFRQYKKLQIDPTSSLIIQQLNDNVGLKKNGLKRIVLFGDSRIYQWNPLPVISGCEIINRGVPGETTSQALLRFDRDVIQLKPDIVILQLGVNDSNIIGVLPEYKNYIMTNSKTNFGMIIKKLKYTKIKTIILSVFPLGKVDLFRLPVWSVKSKDFIKNMNIFLQNFNSTDIIFINCDTFFLENNRMKDKFSIDIIHLNKDGYLVLNQFLTPYIKKLIQ